MFHFSLFTNIWDFHLILCTRGQAVEEPGRWVCLPEQAHSAPERRVPWMKSRAFGDLACDIRIMMMMTMTV